MLCMQSEVKYKRSTKQMWSELPGNSSESGLKSIYYTNLSCGPNEGQGKWHIFRNMQKGLGPQHQTAELCCTPLYTIS